MLAFFDGLLVHPVQVSQLALNKFVDTLSGVPFLFLVLHEANGQLAQINLHVPKIQLRQRHQHRMGFEFRHLVALYLTNKAMRLHDESHRSVMQRPTVDQHTYISLTE